MSKPKAPAFQFYASDFLGSMRVKIMELDERGAYITLLAHAWDEDGLPDDLADIAKLLGLKAQSVKFRRIWKRVGQAFPLVEGRRRNPRQERERAKQAENRVKKVTAAETRWGKRGSKRNAGVDACASAVQCSPSPSSNSIPLNPPVPDGNGGGIRGGEPKAAPEIMESVMADLRPRLVRTGTDDVPLAPVERLP